MTAFVVFHNCNMFVKVTHHTNNNNNDKNTRNYNNDFILMIGAFEVKMLAER